MQTEQTSLGANQYVIDFHIYSGSTGTSTTFSVELTQLSEGNLLKGMYNTSGSAVRTAAATANECIDQLRVVAEWHGGAPTDASDVAFLKNKAITGATLTAAGNAKLLSSTSAVTGVTDYTSSAITVNISNTDALALSVVLENDIVAMRIATNNPEGPEYYTAEEKGESASIYGQTAASNTHEGAVYHSTDGISIASVSNLTIGDKVADPEP